MELSETEGVDLPLDYISNNSGKRLPHLAEALDTPERTVEKWLKKLKSNGKIEFKGSAKIGGYYTT